LDSHALLPRGRNGQAVSQVEHLLISVNRRDPVLHHYPLLGGLLHRGPPALGYTGFFKHTLGNSGSNVEQWDVSRYVGKSHDWRDYLNSRAVVSKIGRVLADPPALWAAESLPSLPPREDGENAEELPVQSSFSHRSGQPIYDE